MAPDSTVTFRRCGMPAKILLVPVPFGDRARVRSVTALPFRTFDPKDFMTVCSATEVSRVYPAVPLAKAWSPSAVTPPPIDRVCRRLPEPMVIGSAVSVLTPGSMTSSVMPVQPEINWFPSEVTESGMVRDGIPLQPKKADVPMEVTPLPSAAKVTPLQPENALLPISAFSRRLSSAVQPEKALLPIVSI